MPTLNGMQHLTGSDLIVAVEGSRSTYADEDALAREHKPGDAVSVKFYRSHRVMTAKVKLDAWPWTLPRA